MLNLKVFGILKPFFQKGFEPPEALKTQANEPLTYP